MAPGEKFTTTRWENMIMARLKMGEHVEPCFQYKFTPQLVGNMASETTFDPWKVVFS